MAYHQQPENNRTILIIGGSYGGISCAHYFLQHALADLGHGISYKVTLVNPSAKFMARTASPRAAVSSKHMPPDKIFWDIAPGFEQYSADHFSFVEGQAVSIVDSLRAVTFSKEVGRQFTISYYALIIATDYSPQTPLLGVCNSRKEVR